jgi:hypothetical protein
MGCCASGCTFSLDVCNTLKMQCAVLFSVNVMRNLQWSDCSWDSASFFTADVTVYARRCKRIGLYSIRGSNLLWSTFVVISCDWFRHIRMRQCDCLLLLRLLAAQSVSLWKCGWMLSCFTLWGFPSIIYVLLCSQKKVCVSLTVNSHTFVLLDDDLCFVSCIWKSFRTSVMVYIENGFQCSWFQYSLHLDGKCGDSQKWFRSCSPLF